MTPSRQADRAPYRPGRGRLGLLGAAFLRTVDGGCLKFPAVTPADRRKVASAKTTCWRLCHSRGLQLRTRRYDVAVAMWAEVKA